MRSRCPTHAETHRITRAPPWNSVYLADRRCRLAPKLIFRNSGETVPGMSSFRVPSSTRRPMGSDLIYDWNEIKRRGPVFAKKPEFDDETLRDGIQSPSVVDPSIEDKITILHLQDKLGITTSDIGLPGAGPRAFEDVLRLAREIADAKLGIRANCACRTVVDDIAPVAEISQRAGIPIEVYTFIGSSPIRQYVENWDIRHILETSEKAIRFAVAQGMDVAYVTEDTTRSRPATSTSFSPRDRSGVKRLVICDRGPFDARRDLEHHRWTHA